MSKSKFFIKYLKQVINSINNLLEKNLNKLKLQNLLNIAQSNKIFLTFVALLILSLSYLLMPNLFKQSDVVLKLKKELLEKFNLELNFSNKLTYNFLPRPHLITDDSFINLNENKISEIKKIKIYLSLENLYSLEKLTIKEVELENANFNLNKSNYNFFINLLDNNYNDTLFKIKDSNIFYRNTRDEVLFINRILKMKYFYEPKELKNFLYSDNEIFNMPYTIEISNNKVKKDLYSKIDVPLLRLQAENKYNYKEDLKLGTIEILHQNLPSIFDYKISKNSFEFDYFDKITNQKFLYNGKFNLSPFYSSLDGNTDQLDLSHLFDSSAIIAQLLKTEIFNNKNINFKVKIRANKILNFNNFKDILINSKIQEGLIDIDDTFFKWKNYAKFNLFNSLIHVKNGELFLEGSSNINLININEIFKFLVTPKNYRLKIKNIDLNYSYNFNQKTINLNDIRIDGKYNDKVNKKLNSILIKNDDLQNKIYFKNLLNGALKSYDG